MFPTTHGGQNSSLHSAGVQSTKPCRKGDEPKAEPTKGEIGVFLEFICVKDTADAYLVVSDHRIDLIKLSKILGVVFACSIASCVHMAIITKLIAYEIKP